MLPTAQGAGLGEPASARCPGSEVRYSLSSAPRAAAPTTKAGRGRQNRNAAHAATNTITASCATSAPHARRVGVGVVVMRGFFFGESGSGGGSRERWRGPKS